MNCLVGLHCNISTLLIRPGATSTGKQQYAADGNGNINVAFLHYLCHTDAHTY